MAVQCTHRLIGIASLLACVGCGSTPSTESANVPSVTVPGLAQQVVPTATQSPVEPPRPNSIAEVNDAQAFGALESANLQATKPNPSAKAPTIVTREQMRVPSDMDVEDLTFRRSVKREWSSRGGSFKVQAKLVAFVEGLAVLQKDDGKFVRVPLDKLAETDVQYIQGLIKVHPKAYLIMGKVTTVTSGSELVIDSGNWPRSVELFAIASPKQGQFYHDESKATLAAKVAGKYVWLEWTEKSESGNPLGVLYLNGRNINLDLLSEGVALCDPKYTAEPKFVNAETIAKSRHLGIWQRPDVKPPWE